MKRKVITNALKNEIRNRFELGDSLIDLSLEYKISYGTLKNISSSENWQKGIIKNIARVKEIFSESEKLCKKQKKVKKEYERITGDMRKIFLEKMKSRTPDTKLFKAEEEALKNRINALESLFSVDKDLYSIMNPAELLKLKQETLKYLVMLEEFRGRGVEDAATLAIKELKEAVLQDVGDMKNDN